MARRPYVIIVRAGDASQHERWLQGGPRNFDVVVSYSGNQSGRFSQGVDYYHAAPGAAWPTFHALLAHYMKLMGRYERVALAGDNFAVDATWWNTLFHICDWFGLDQGHPSVMDHGWEAMRPHPGCLMRYVGLVDCLAPVFSRRALERVHSTFDQGLAGADLSSAWSQLLPWPDYRCAIVDTVHVRCTVPMPASVRSLEIPEHARLRLTHEELQER